MKRLLVTAHLLALAVLAYPPLGQAQTAPVDGVTKSVRAVRTDEPITIDGRLDERAWAGAATVEDIHQILPEEFAEPSQYTVFLILYDDDALYLAARMHDDQPDRIVAKVLRQGGVSWLDDQFNIFLDPFNDKRSGYRFQVNPHGVRGEGLFKDAVQVQWEWAGIWQAAATRDDEGWIAETRIPFKTISFDPANDTWGINFNRRVARSNEYMGWVSRNRLQSPAISGEITGLEGLDQGLGLDLVPYITAGEQRRYSPDSGNSEFEPSLDVFYKITPALNASLTLNTDFSATEVDDRQVNLTRFGLFFPEQRDFFLQDADIFEFGRIGQRERMSPFARPLAENARPFFSRRIGLSASGQPVDLEVGGKLSGRIGRWNIGSLAIRQDAFEGVEATNLFVGRMSANVLSESTLGFIVTDGDPQSNADNSLRGVDFRYQNTRLPGGRVIESEVWYQQTATDGLTGEDSAWGAGIWAPNSVGFRGGAGVKEVQENFNPALGFINRKGIRDVTAELGYTYRPGAGYMRSLYGGAVLHRIARLTGGLQSEVSMLRANLENQTNDILNFTYQNNKEGLVQPFEIADGVVIPPGIYSFDQVSTGLTSSGHRRVAANVILGKGDFFDGTQDTAAVQVELTPVPRFRALIGYQHNDIELPQGSFVRRLTRVGLDVIFSSKLSWVNLFQYDNGSEIAGVNSRLHWVPQAGRELFVVVNHNIEDFDRDNEFHSNFTDFSFQYRHTFRF